MASAENAMQPDRVKSTVEQHIAIPSATGDETPSAHETISGVHRYIFDVLAFFSNCQSSLIADYCQDTENVIGGLSFATAFALAVLLVEPDSTLHQRRTLSSIAGVLQ